jgi:hypothetical protein
LEKRTSDDDVDDDDDDDKKKMLCNTDNLLDIHSLIAVQ